jgi:hypothetical protein
MEGRLVAKGNNFLMSFEAHLAIRETFDWPDR